MRGGGYPNALFDLIRVRMSSHIVFIRFLSLLSRCNGAHKASCNVVYSVAPSVPSIHPHSRAHTHAHTPSRHFVVSSGLCVSEEFMM